MAHRLRAPLLWLSVAAAALLAGAAAPAAGAAGGVHVTPSRIEAKVREGERIPSVTITNRTGQTVFVTALASPAGQELSGLPRFDLSPKSLRAGAGRLTVFPPRFRLAAGESRRVRATAGAPARGTIASYAVVAFTARPRGSRDGGSVLEPALRLTTNVMLRYPGRERIRGHLAGAHVEQGPRRTLRFFARVRNTGNLHFAPDSRLTVFSAAGKPVVRGRFPAENVLPGALRDTALPVAKLLPRGNYRARVVTRDGHRLSVRRFPFRLVGPNELAAAGLKILSLPMPQPDAGEDFEARVRVENSGNVPFAPRGTVVLKKHGGGAIAGRTVNVGRLGPAEQGDGKVELPAVDEGRYQLSIRFEDGDRVLAERTIVFTTGAAPPLLDRILDWLAAHLRLLVGGFAALLALLVASWLAHARHLRRRQARALSLAQLEREAAQREHEAAQREHEARLAALEAKLLTAPAQPRRESDPRPFLVAGFASVLAFVLGGSRARRR